MSIWSSVFPDEVGGRECRASDLDAEPPNCPACGQPVHVEWADVSRIDDLIPRVLADLLRAAKALDEMEGYGP